GILNGADYQIVYSDTPGILDPKYKLHEGMMKAVGSALTDADLLLMVVDLSDSTPFHAATLEKLTKIKIPIFVILNKYDLAGNDRANVVFSEWQVILPNAKIFPVSALENIYTKELLNEIIAVLPSSPPYFPKDELSDKTMRFFASEIIREKIFMTYDKEIPYCCEVLIESYKDEPELTRISAVILTERESQKAILIGHQGKMLKRVGTEARKDLESFLGRKVFLQTHVKVEKWRNNHRTLTQLGYMEQ
ncbi:MAG: GTPase Era, partial [Bacteroidota bacterium]